MTLKYDRAYLLHARHTRSPIGKNGGALRNVKPHDLAAKVLRRVLNDTAINPSDLSSVIIGQAYQNASEAPDISRYAAQLAGIPDSVFTYTVNAQCGSGLIVIAEAMEKIWAGTGGLHLVGGVDVMSSIPFYLPGNLRWEGAFARLKPKLAKFYPLPTLLLGPLNLAENGIAPRKHAKSLMTLDMAGTAEEIFTRLGISIDEIDQFAVFSQARAQKAINEGLIAEEIVPINTGRLILSADENPRADTTIEGMAKFRNSGSPKAVIPPTASPIADGAAFTLIGSASMAEHLQMEPLVELVDFAVSGLPHETMGLGPVYAVRELLERNGLTIDDIGLGELNEAFSVVFVGCQKMLGFDRSRWNIRGGALAYGHPIAMTGTRIANRLALDMPGSDTEYGIAVACVAGGRAVAILVRRI
jgi:acetyl-CoA C-acetyltransferase